MAIRLRILDFHSPDVESLARWMPDDPSAVYLLVEMSIGEQGARAADLFSVMAATPEGLSRRARGDSVVISERGLVVVSEFDWPAIRQHLEAIVRRCEADTWVECVLRLQRFFMWEYEDMVQEEDG
jgi:hypothetical protein